jgi:hypothetical protein
VAGGGNDGGRWWAALHCSHATWTVENAKDEGRRMRRGRGRAVVGSAVHCSVSCLLLPRLCLPALYLFFFFRASV